MESKRILTINHVRSILMEGVEDILGAKNSVEFELLSTPANNLGELVHEIEQLKPNVIIMEEASSFIKPVDLITSVLSNRNIRLIVLNSRYSKMDIYDKSEFTVSSLEHFIEALNYGIQ